MNGRMNDYLTLRELKAMLPTTEEYTHIPTAKHIRSSGDPVAVYESTDYQIAVYPCGFAIGKSGRRTTAVRVDECGSYHYDVDNSENTAFWNGEDESQHYFTEDFFLDQPWPVRLMMTVDDQLQKNEDNRERGGLGRHPEIPDDKNWMRGVYYSFEDSLIHQMLMEEMLVTMTEKQRQVFLLYSKVGYTQQEIGKMIGISQEGVSRHLRAALKKVEKFLN